MNYLDLSELDFEHTNGHFLYDDKKVYSQVAYKEKDEIGVQLVIALLKDGTYVLLGRYLDETRLNETLTVAKIATLLAANNHQPSVNYMRTHKINSLLS